MRSILLNYELHVSGCIQEYETYSYNMTRLRKNIIYNVLGRTSTLILSFVAVKYIYSGLGEDALGLIYFVMAINTLLSFALDMGVSTTTTREVSAHYGSDSRYIKDLIQTASLLYWSIFVLIGASIFLIAPYLVENWIILKSIDNDAATTNLRILGISSFLALPKSLYASIFKGLQRMEYNNVIDVVLAALRQGGIIVVLTQNYGLLEVVCWIASTYILEIVVYVWSTTKFLPPDALMPSYSHHVVLRNVSFALNMMAITICRIIHRQLDKLVLSKLLPIGTLGTYSLAQRGVSLGELVSSAINLAAYPSFAANQGGKNSEVVTARYWKLQDLMSVGNALVIGFIPFAMVPILTLVFSRDIAEDLFIPVVLLCLHSYLFCIRKIPTTIAVAFGFPEIEFKTLFYSLFIVIPFSIFTIDRYGLVGAPLGLLLLDIIYLLYAMPRICTLCLDFPMSKWYVHAMAYTALFIVSYGSLLLINTKLGTTNLLSLLSCYVIATVIFIVCSFFIMSDDFKHSIVITFRSYVHGINGFR